MYVELLRYLKVLQQEAKQHSSLLETNKAGLTSETSNAGLYVVNING